MLAKEAEGEICTKLKSVELIKNPALCYKFPTFLCTVIRVPPIICSKDNLYKWHDGHKCNTGEHFGLQNLQCLIEKIIR